MDFKALRDTEQGAAKLSKWLIRSGRLGQFSLVKQLLYGNGRDNSEDPNRETEDETEVLTEEG